MIIPPYQAELCHPDIRGRVTALQQFMLGVGALTATWITWACYTQIPDDNSGQWRIPLGIQNVPAAILAALIMFFPESPRYVVTWGVDLTVSLMQKQCADIYHRIVGLLITARQRRVF